MELIFDTTPKGSHTVTLMYHGRAIKGFLSQCPIKCINKGQEWLKRAKIALKLNLN